MMEKKEKECPYSWKQRFKMMGWAGFLFFLIKGLMWLVVPSVLAYFGMKS